MSNNITPQAVTEICPGLYQEWLLDRRIVAYRVTAVSQSVLENWSSLVRQTLRDWDKDWTYLALHDLTAPGVATMYASLTHYDMLNIGVTQDGRLGAEGVFVEFPGFIGRVAISFNLTVSGHIGKTLLNYYMDKHPAVEYKSFYSREKSLKWLLSHLPDSIIAAK